MDMINIRMTGHHDVCIDGTTPIVYALSVRNVNNADTVAD